MLSILEAEVDRLNRTNQTLVDNLRCAQDELVETNMELIETQRREALIVRLYMLEMERRPKKLEEEL